MDILWIIALLCLATTCRCHSGLEDALLIQSWKLLPAVRLLPLTEVYSECNGGALLALRLTANILKTENKEMTRDAIYLVHSGNCTVSATEKLLEGLEEQVEDCYQDDACESVDLLQGFYKQLIALECSICSSGCAVATSDLLLTFVNYTLEVQCQVSTEEGQLLSLHNLNSTGQSSLMRYEFPVESCKNGLEVQQVFLSNQLPKSLIPSEEEEQQIESLSSSIKTCLADSSCQGVDIATRGITTDEGLIQPDHVLGVYWMCNGVRVPLISKNGLTPKGQRYKAALIAVSILFVLALGALAGVVLYCVRKRQQTKTRYRYAHTLSGGRRTETLPKYERSVENLTAEHRYTDLSLKPAAAEGLYEYMDMESERATSHKGADVHKGATSQLDADGYMVPNTA
ncbi:uncharacterized protein [Watersipora subatra]|uniref:uncharacterized protein n=1 Tax=Watersipora subatra TaxID=2589382 RepID=UPI00355C524A